jgi:hypothetical protein
MAKRTRTSRNRQGARSHVASRRGNAQTTLGVTPTGILPGVLRTVGVLTIGTVELVATVLATAVRGAVTVGQLAVDGVRSIGGVIADRRSPTAPHKAAAKRHTSRQAA